MNILYLCDEYPPGQHGGIGTALQLLALEMVRQGHKVIVAGLYGLGYGCENKFEDLGVKVYRFRRGFDAKWFANQQSLPVRISMRILKDTGLLQWDIKRSLASYKNKLDKIIADNHIDIVEMPDYNDYMRFCRSFVAFPKLSVPVIVKMHGSFTYTRGGANIPPHIIKMEQAILNQAAAVAGVSRYVADKSAEHLAYPGKIEVLYNGINTAVQPRSIYRNPKQVIYTGALVQGKGIYQLVKAWNKVIETMPDARLLVLGKGPRQKVTAYLSSAAKNTVILKGHVAKEDLYDDLWASAISVFPSYSEAFALAPMEAMACGTAVINSSRTSGPELIDDKINGLLVDPENVEQIASAILYLLNNPDACAKLAMKGNKRIKAHFDIAKIAAANVKFYQAVQNR